MARKTKIGTVLHVNAPTIRIRVDWMRPHPIYNKQYRKSRSLLAHLPTTVQVQVGDQVEIEETRPISRSKSWRVTRLISAAKAQLQDDGEQA